MYPLLAPIVCVIGLILYFLPFQPNTPTNAKVTEIGKIAIWLGLGFSLYFYGGR